MNGCFCENFSMYTPSVVSLLLRFSDEDLRRDIAILVRDIDFALGLN